MHPQPVRDPLLLNGFHIHLGKCADGAAALVVAIRDVAIVVRFRVKDLRWDVSLWQNGEEVDPYSAKLFICLHQLAYDLVDNTGFAGRMLDPVGQLRWSAFRFFDDPPAERMERRHPAFQRFLIDVQLPGDPFLQFVSGALV